MFTQFLAMVIRASVTSHGSYQIPLTERQQSAAEALVASLSTLSDMHEAIHNLALSLFATSSTSVLEDGFSCPLVRFMILVNVQHDGQIQEPKRITPRLSMLQYCIRAVMYREMLKRQGEFEGGLLG